MVRAGRGPDTPPMRRAPLPLGALVLLAAPVPAFAGTGGTEMPPPVVREFSIAPAALVVGQKARVVFRIDGPLRRVRTALAFTPAGSATPTVFARMGWKRTGVRYARAWTPAAPGEYTVALQATDRAGRELRRTARMSGRSRVSVQPAPPPAPAGAFPVAGAYSLGGPEMRFGAGRPGHAHQGQDISAAAGTPVVAPVAGAVHWVAYQGDGAGHYVVERGADGRDYVFMHLLAGSVAAVKGQVLAAGQPFAAVGSTGRSSGPHLHFEIWPDEWYSSAASRPIDPLPDLLAWAGTR